MYQNYIKIGQNEKDFERQIKKNINYEYREQSFHNEYREQPFHNENNQNYEYTKELLKNHFKYNEEQLHNEILLRLYTRNEKYLSKNNSRIETRIDRSHEAGEYEYAFRDFINKYYTINSNKQVILKPFINSQHKSFITFIDIERLKNESNIKNKPSLDYIEDKIKVLNDKPDRFEFFNLLKKYSKLNKNYPINIYDKHILLSVIKNKTSKLLNQKLKELRKRLLKGVIIAKTLLKEYSDPDIKKLKIYYEKEKLSKLQIDSLLDVSMYEDLHINSNISDICDEIKTYYNESYSYDNIILLKDKIEIVIIKLSETKTILNSMLISLLKRYISLLDFSELEKLLLKNKDFNKINSNNNTINIINNIDSINRNIIKIFRDYVQTYYNLQIRLSEIDELIRITDYFESSEETLKMKELLRDYDIIDDEFIRLYSILLVNRTEQSMNKHYYLWKILKDRLYMINTYDNYEDFKKKLIQNKIKIIEEHIYLNSIVMDINIEALEPFTYNDYINYINEHIYYTELLSNLHFTIDFLELSDEHINKGDGINGSVGGRGTLYNTLIPSNNVIKEGKKDKLKIFYETIKHIIIYNYLKQFELSHLIVTPISFSFGYLYMYFEMEKINQNNTKIIGVPKKGDTLTSMINNIKFANLSSNEKSDIICNIMIKVNKVLYELQEKIGLIHNDMNLGNIMVDYDNDYTINNIYLIDYEHAIFKFDKYYFLYRDEISHQNIDYNIFLKNEYAKVFDNIFLIYSLFYRLYYRIKTKLKPEILTLTLPINNENNVIKNNEERYINKLIPRKLFNIISEQILGIPRTINLYKSSDNYLPPKYRNKYFFYNFINEQFTRNFFYEIYKKNGLLLNYETIIQNLKPENLIRLLHSFNIVRTSNKKLYIPSGQILWDKKYNKYWNLLKQNLNMNDWELSLKIRFHMDVSVDTGTRRKITKRTKALICDKYSQLFTLFIKEYYDKDDSGSMHKIKYEDRKHDLSYINHNKMIKHLDGHIHEYSDKLDLSFIIPKINFLNPKFDKFNYIKLLQKHRNVSSENFIFQTNEEDFFNKIIKQSCEVLLESKLHDLEKEFLRMFIISNYLSNPDIQIDINLIIDYLTSSKNHESVDEIIKKYINDTNAGDGLDIYLKTIPKSEINNTILYRVIKLIQIYIKDDYSPDQIKAVLSLKIYNKLEGRNIISNNKTTILHGMSRYYDNFKRSVFNVSLILKKTIDEFYCSRIKNELELLLISEIKTLYEKYLIFSPLEESILNETNTREIIKDVFKNDVLLYQKCMKFIMSDEDIDTYFEREKESFDFLQKYDIIDDAFFNYYSYILFDLLNKFNNKKYYLKQILIYRLKLINDILNSAQFILELKEELIHITEEHILNDTILMNYPLEGYSRDTCIIYNKEQFIYTQQLCHILFISNFLDLTDENPELGNIIPGAKGGLGSIYNSKIHNNRVIKKQCIDKFEYNWGEFAKHCYFYNIIKEFNDTNLFSTITVPYSISFGCESIYFEMERIYSNDTKNNIVKKGDTLPNILNNLKFAELSENIKSQIICDILISIFKIFNKLQIKMNFLHFDMNLNNIMVNIDYTDEIYTLNNVYIIDYEKIIFNFNDIYFLYKIKYINYDNYYANDYKLTYDSIYLLYSLFYRLYYRVQNKINKNIKLLNSSLNEPLNKNKYINRILPRKLRNDISIKIFGMSDKVDLYKSGANYLNKKKFHTPESIKYYYFNFINDVFTRNFFMEIDKKGELLTNDDFPTKFHNIMTRLRADNLINILTEIKKTYTENVVNGQRPLILLNKVVNEQSSSTQLLLNMRNKKRPSTQWARKQPILYTENTGKRPNSSTQWARKQPILNNVQEHIKHLVH
jgi:hypothetical protein